MPDQRTARNLIIKRTANQSKESPMTEDLRAMAERIAREELGPAVTQPIIDMAMRVAREWIEAEQPPRDAGKETR